MSLHPRAQVRYAIAEWRNLVRTYQVYADRLCFKLVALLAENIDDVVDYMPHISKFHINQIISLMAPAL